MRLTLDFINAPIDKHIITSSTYEYKAVTFGNLSGLFNKIS